MVGGRLCRHYELMGGVINLINGVMDARPQSVLHKVHLSIEVQSYLVIINTNMLMEAKLLLWSKIAH